MVLTNNQSINANPLKIKIMKTLSLVLTMLLFLNTQIFAQESNYSVTGTIFNEADYSVIVGAIITIKTNSMIFKARTDKNGYFEINNLKEGIYSYSVDYDKFMFSKNGYFKLGSFQYNKTKYLSIRLINHQNRNTNAVYTISSPIPKAPNQNINAIAAYVRGVDSRNGETPSIKGARPENTAYYIDGVRVNYFTGELIIGKQ